MGFRNFNNLKGIKLCVYAIDNKENQMVDILGKIVAQILGKDATGMTAVLCLIIGYLAWKNYSDGKIHREELTRYSTTLKDLQESLTSKNGEERQTLLAIIDKYSNSQISVTQALSEIKGVLSSLSSFGRGG